MSVKIVVKTLDGDTVFAEVDGDTIEMLLTMSEREHVPVERKFLSSEDRYVYVGDGDAPRKRILRSVQLVQPGETVMGKEEFEARLNGTFKKKEHPIKQLINQLAKMHEEEESKEDKPTLN